ncbi:MULE domain-containing protein, partial [Aphis craccivora]
TICLIRPIVLFLYNNHGKKYLRQTQRQFSIEVYQQNEKAYRISAQDYQKLLPNGELINNEDVHNALQEHHLLTAENENFVLVLIHHIIFSCDKNLNSLIKLEIIYSTFQYSAKHILQMFTIHGLNNDYYNPLAFFLLPDKETQIYIKAFTHLSKECLKRGLIFSPDTVFANFEISIHTAVQKVWATFKIKGCRFHLAQTWKYIIQFL